MRIWSRLSWQAVAWVLVHVNKSHKTLTQTSMNFWRNRATTQVVKKAVRTALHKLSRVVSVHKLAHCGGPLCANELLLSVCPRKLVADKASDISVLYLWQSRYITDHLRLAPTIVARNPLNCHDYICDTCVGHLSLTCLYVMTWQGPNYPVISSD